jgi:hypothetical protein
MADDQLNLSFTGRARSPLIRRLTALAAPIAIDAGSIIDDEELLDVARAVCAAFSHDDAAGGLTKAEIAARVNGACDPATLDSRLGVFLRSEMLRPVYDKKHQQRYVLAPAALVGILIFDRVSERGGVEELLSLLDRTKSALERHEADAPAVAAALESCRAMFAVFANELNRLVTGATLPELLAERRFHDDRDFIERVAELQRLVTDDFPALDPAAYKLLLEAQRYIAAVEDLLNRVLDEGGDATNLQLLDPEEYLTAARNATLDELAIVAAEIVFDPAAPWVDAGDVLDAVESYRPRRVVRTRPPEPAGDPTRDPIEEMRAAAERATRRRALRAEALLDGAPDADVTDQLRAAGWPGAGRMLADLLTLAHTEQPYTVTLGDALHVDPDGPLTYISPVHIAADRSAGLPAALEITAAEVSADG